ncbi:hypothetical protein MPSEU_000379600 [Mayamaea pseudoterrestris]|nr:hypothetical protein MPSEU_000379600 [Mayamaea pseudoterrestris]
MSATAPPICTGSLTAIVYISNEKHIRGAGRWEEHCFRAQNIPKRLNGSEMNVEQYEMNYSKLRLIAAWRTRQREIYLIGNAKAFARANTTRLLWACYSAVWGTS